MPSSCLAYGLGQDARPLSGLLELHYRALLNPAGHPHGCSWGTKSQLSQEIAAKVPDTTFPLESPSQGTRWNSKL